MPYQNMQSPIPQGKLFFSCFFDEIIRRLALASRSAWKRKSSVMGTKIALDGRGACAARQEACAGVQGVNIYTSRRRSTLLVRDRHAPDEPKTFEECGEHADH
jgi:hypothetical protein